MDAEFFCGFGNRQFYTVYHDIAAATAIPGVFFSCYPTAVFWRVAGHIVFAFKLMNGRWFRSHISKEVLKRFHPSFADGNTARAVSFITNLTRFCATHSHRIPGKVFSRIRHAMSQSIGCTAFFFIASAALRTTSKTITSYGFNRAALALAYPVRSTTRYLTNKFIEIKNRPTVKLLTRNISHVFHMKTSIIDS